MFLIKLFASVLSTLAVIIGTALAVPQSREFILNAVAPFSQVYEDQSNQNLDLKTKNIANLETIAEAQQALACAEQQSTSLRSELILAQNDLTQLTSELELAQANLLSAQTSFSNQASLFEEEIENLNVLINSKNSELILLQQQIDSQQTTIEQLNLQIENLQNQLNNQSNVNVLTDWKFENSTATYIGENTTNVVVPSSYSLGEEVIQTQTLTFNSFTDIEMYNMENDMIFLENQGISFYNSTGYGMNYSMLERYNMDFEFQNALMANNIDFNSPYYCELSVSQPTYIEGSDYNVSEVIINNVNVNYTITDNITRIIVKALNENNINFNIPTSVSSISFISCGAIGNIDFSTNEGLSSVEIFGTTSVNTLTLPSSITKVYTQPYFSSLANVLINNSTSVTDIQWLFNYTNFTSSQFGHSGVNIYVPDAMMQSYYDLIDSYDRCVEKELCKAQIKALSTYLEV